MNVEEPASGEEPAGGAHALIPPSVETCRYRRSVALRQGDEIAECGLLRELLARLPPETHQVSRRACAACCQSFPPSRAVLNPVIAGRVFDSLQHGDLEASDESLLRWAEQFLDFDASCFAPNGRSNSYFAATVDAALRDILPLPRQRCAPRVQCWAVGVTTAPRRQATLDPCLDSLAAAGWQSPRLFVDGQIRVSERFRTLPATCRSEPLGAWPNYYLALAELLMHEPLADAYLLVQDDAVFFHGESVREYLQDALWPGKIPGIVSLYWSIPDDQPQFGWRRAAGRWKCGAVALVFPRHIAIRFVHDRSVLAHRWSNEGQGLTGIPDVIEQWARKRSVSLYYPTPSFVQHVGAASSIWLGSNELTRGRRARYFVGDVIAE